MIVGSLLYSIAAIVFYFTAVRKAPLAEDKVIVLEGALPGEMIELFPQAEQWKNAA